MRTPEMYTVKEGLAGLHDLTVMSALRGPDGKDMQQLKYHTAAVIRFWVKGAGSWGAVSALPFVVATDGGYWEHYELHIRHAANTIGLQMLEVSEEVVRALPRPPRDLTFGWHIWARSWIEACYEEAGEERPKAPETDV
ncbi:hypothetical protein LCGC14_1102750 [marine sediment metagenome]|uniref:Uncharacterized protein n=1 Tax=marine sediment metagenome TaxID=412755 RepID=A0A0F9M903_9ZZZZ